MKREQSGKLTPLMMLRLAAPHTWAASVMPALLGTVLAAREGVSDPVMSLLLTAVCVLMQSAVNTFNDYSDFIKGTDTLENSPDADDAVMVHDRPSPRRVLILGFAFLLAAALCAVPALLQAGWRPLAVGLVGAAAVLCYSFGKKPLSYLPLGELVSGFVMGGLIPFAVHGVLTLRFDPSALLFSLPMILGIALIMMTNNGCDIARDSAAGRRTFAVYLGQRRCALVYRVLLCLWAVLPLPLLLTEGGALVYLIAMLPVGVSLSAQLKTGLSPGSRRQAMSGISALNLLGGTAYLTALCFGAAVH